MSTIHSLEIGNCSPNDRTDPFSPTHSHSRNGGCPQAQTIKSTSVCPLQELRSRHADASPSDKPKTSFFPPQSMPQKTKVYVKSSACRMSMTLSKLEMAHLTIGLTISRHFSSTRSLSKNGGCRQVQTVKLPSVGPPHESRSRHADASASDEFLSPSVNASQE